LLNIVSIKVVSNTHCAKSPRLVFYPRADQRGPARTLFFLRWGLLVFYPRADQRGPARTFYQSEEWRVTSLNLGCGSANSSKLGLRSPCTRFEEWR